MKRSILLELLKAYNPTAPEELVAKKRTIEFVEQYENCFERSLDVGHITGSAWLLNQDGTKTLLLHHAKLGQWFQLGGHCDGDHDVLGVAIKEAQEESGIKSIVPVSTKIFDIDVHFIPANSREKEHFHYDVRFLLQVTSDEQIVQNSESKELRWVDTDRSKLPTDSLSVTRMFDKWIALTKDL